MDKKWMSVNRLSEEYKNRVDFFLRFCLENGGDPNFTCCPCLKCFNVTKLSFNKIKEHLFFNGIDRSYKIWYSHGEKPPNIPDPPSRISKVRRNRDEVNWDSLDEMIDDARYGSTVDPNKFETLLSDAEKPIYPDCKRFTKLSMLLRLFNLKAKHGWSDRSLTELLSFLKELLPECNEMPMSFYEAEKTICSLGMEYEKIHACPNDCILYRNRLSDAESCPTCGESRWKKKRNGEDVKEGIPANVLWYLPPIPRFIRLFRNAELAKSLSWNANERVKDGNDIDVYLAPLIDDLKTLWNEGVRVYDAYKQEEFSLRATLLWTINDFPAYGNLSGFSVKGYKACPICEEETCSQYLKHSRKSKDGIKAREDLTALKIRNELAPKPGNGRTFLPPACYTLTKDEKREVYDCLFNIKVPDGYCSNIRSLVDMKTCTLTGMKSHDCHILMQHVLPIAIRSVLPKNVREIITRLCLFFKSLCSKEVDVYTLDKLQHEIAYILCKLEQFFPPAFFDIMIHLTVHLVREVQFCGPVYFRWVYPFERYMKILKGYIRNRSRPEGCIIECYIVEEAIEFCSEYMSGVQRIRLNEVINADIQSRRGSVVCTVTRDELNEAHRLVLQNTNEIQPYIEQHFNWIKTKFPSRSKNKKWLQDEHYRTFSSWLEQKVVNDLRNPLNNVSDIIKWICRGPSLNVTKFSSYMVNEIWELDYIITQVPVFFCDWVKSDSGVKKEDLGFTLVNLNLLGHKTDRFIMATQATQVFYVDDPANTVMSSYDPLANDSNEEENEEEVREEEHMEEGDIPSRGPSFLKKISKLRSEGKQIKVEYNEFGQAIGDGRVDLASKLGSIVRTTISIEYKDWVAVPQEKKRQIWEIMEETFGLDHTHKKGLLTKAAKRFRSWRTYLTKRFIVDQMEKIPNEFPPRRPRGYESIISPEVWLDFVNKRLSNDWKIIREKMQAL
ncbi:uncharacterized protein LOC133785274 [Humulus lupulus]|uniref:uncharacterized protein LOC133785274 n=1 Tax=Humulus lupulus TaxID=3486 RepID=UPI002B4031B3|nr:uncharacterized protein LOC133785274 [Humulus lupulus]